MTLFGKVSFGIAVTLASALLGNSQLARADARAKVGITLKDSVRCCPVCSIPPGIVVTSAKRKGERKVRVDVDKVVSIAIGDGASARMHIADSSTQPAGAHTSTVRVGTISHTVLGPKASSCIALPFLEDAKACDEQENVGTAHDQ
jgi:hypothetical protein